MGGVVGVVGGVSWGAGIHTNSVYKSVRCMPRNGLGVEGDRVRGAFRIQTEGSVTQL